MRIALVYDMIYPYYVGGAEIRNRELSARLAEKHEVHLFGVKLWDGPDVFEEDGVTVHGVCGYGKQNSFSGSRTTSDVLRFAAAITKPLIRERFDVIDVSAFPPTQHITARLASAATEAKLILTWHQFCGEYLKLYLGPLMGSAAAHMERMAAKTGPSHVAVSEHVKKNLLSAGADPADVYVNVNGVDLAATAAAKPADEAFDLSLIHI